MKKFKKGEKVRCIKVPKGGIPVPCIPVYQGIYTWNGYSAHINCKGCGYLKEIPRMQRAVDGIEYSTPFSDVFFERATEGNSETYVATKKVLEEVTLN